MALCNKFCVLHSLARRCFVLQTFCSLELAEEEEKARKAASLLQQNRKKFEHVRKLIKSDPDVVKSNRKKKRKKRKKVKKKKRRQRSESETTNTANETGSHSSEADEWVEIDHTKRSPRKTAVPGLREEHRAMSTVGYETAKNTTRELNVVNLTSDNNVNAAMIQDRGTRKSSEQMELNESKLFMRRKSEENLNKGDMDCDESHAKGQERQGRYVRRRSSHSPSHEDWKISYEENISRKGRKNFQDTSSDSSVRSSRENSLKRDRLIRGRRSVSKDSRGRRSTSRDSTRRRNSRRKRRSRNRSNSLERDRSRTFRGWKGTSQGSKGLRSTSRSNSNERKRSRSRSKRERRSTSMHHEVVKDGEV